MRFSMRRGGEKKKERERGGADGDGGERGGWVFGDADAVSVWVSVAAALVFARFGWVLC